MDKILFNINKRYVISCDGKIVNIQTKKEIKQKINIYGYKIVRLSNNNKRKAYLVHRLIAINFIKNSSNKPQVNHINGNKLDNRIENLEWCTLEENMKHAWRNNYFKKAGIVNSIRTRKLSDKHQEEIILKHNLGTNKHILAKEYNVSERTIRRALKINYYVYSSEHKI